MDVRFQHPFIYVIAGATGSGKTDFVTRWLHYADAMINFSPEKIYWHYGAWQTQFESIPNVEFIEGLPNIENVDKTKRTLIIIDDLMNETNRSVTNLFTKGSHHYNCSVIYIVQNLFNQNKENRTISLNSHYIVAFKNPRDASQIVHLAKQSHPSRPKVVQEAFLDATSKPFGYLLFDFTQKIQDSYRLRTQIFPDKTNFVYTPI